MFVCAGHMHCQQHRRNLQRRPCGRLSLRSIVVPFDGTIMPHRKLDHAACIAWQRITLWPSYGVTRSYRLLQQCHARARGWTLTKSSASDTMDPSCRIPVPSGGGQGWLAPIDCLHRHAHWSSMDGDLTRSRTACSSWGATGVCRITMATSYIDMVCN